MGLDRPLGVQEVEAPKIYRQSGREGGKVVSFTHRAPLLLAEDPCISFSQN